MNTRSNANDAASDAAPTRLLLAGAARDAAGVRHRPAAIRLAGSRVLEVGATASITPRPGEPVEHRPGSLILPALVNAHTHLDLTHIGPRPHMGDFVSWVDVIRAERRLEPDEIADATRLGVEKSLAGGVAIVGDISGVHSLAPARALAASPLRGASFVEFFGVGRWQAASIDRMRAVAEEAGDLEGVRLGLQPHAPYSAGPDLYAAAVELAEEFDLPLSTHLAETLEEIEFTRDARGPQADLLKRLEKWDESIRPYGEHPIDALAPILIRRPWIVAHVNYAEDAHLDELANSRVSVAYCARASDYFGHAGHRYRDMLARGINVALGTDSIVNLDTADRISTWDEMRHLRRRDGVDGETLLQMATTNGARALGLDPGLVTLAPGPVAGLLATPFDADDPADPLEQALDAERVSLEWIVRPG
ncbi:MAG: amidohydrolase family protein [Phycisphaerales bacterium]